MGKILPNLMIHKSFIIAYNYQTPKLNKSLNLKDIGK